MKVLISKKTGNTYYTSGEEDYHCKEGIISKDDLEKGELPIYSHTGKEFLVFDANNYDLSNKYKRGPQLITPKDLGYILSRTFLDRNSVIIEAGGGCGAATCFFGKLIQHVYSFEVKKDHISLMKKNMKLQDVENVDLTQGDLIESIDYFSPKSVDMVFLDLPEPFRILEKSLDCLKNGKYIVCYVPSITQILSITQVVGKRNDYYLEEVSEISKREWKVWGQVARPHHRKEIDHTAFLVFIRKS